MAFPVAQSVKKPPTMQDTQETQVQSLGWEESLEEGMATAFQYSCLENPMDSGAWQATVYEVTKSQTRLKQISMHTKILKNIEYISCF